MTPRATALPIAITITLMTTTAGFGQSPFGRVLDLGHPLSATDPTWTGTPRMGRIAAEEHNGGSGSVSAVTNVDGTPSGR